VVGTPILKLAMVKQFIKKFLKKFAIRLEKKFAKKFAKQFAKTFAKQFVKGPQGSSKNFNEPFKNSLFTPMRKISTI
jgi:hypothetical protein